MNIIEHCITDRRSLIAVVKRLRAQGINRLFIPYHIYNDLFYGDYPAWKWVQSYGYPRWDGGINEPPYGIVRIIIWPKGIDDECEAFDRSQQLSSAP